MKKALPVLLIALFLSTSCLSASATPATAATRSTATPEAVVREDFHALSTGDAEALAAVFAPEIEMYRLPTQAHTLTGPRSDKMRTREELRTYFKQAFGTVPLARHEVLEMVSLGELVLVRVAIHTPDNTPADHALTAFRVRGGVIEAIWHIAQEQDAERDSGSGAKLVAQRLEDAGNRGDADAFVALYHPDAKHFHPRRDPTRLGGGPSERITDQASRGRAYREAFANGPSAQVEILGMVALDEWVAVRGLATNRDGTMLDNLSMYRVRDGLIIDDWHLADRKRAP